MWNISIILTLRGREKSWKGRSFNQKARTIVCLSRAVVLISSHLPTLHSWTGTRLAAALLCHNFHRRRPLPNQTRHSTRTEPFLPLPPHRTGSCGPRLLERSRQRRHSIEREVQLYFCGKRSHPRKYSFGFRARCSHSAPQTCCAGTAEETRRLFLKTAPGGYNCCLVLLTGWPNFTATVPP